MYFLTGLNLVLQQPSTAVLAKTKAILPKRALIPTHLVVCPYLAFKIPPNPVFDLDSQNY